MNLPRAVYLLAAEQGLRGIARIFFLIALTLTGVRADDLSGLGVTLAVQGLPVLLFSYYGGIAADRWHAVKTAQCSALAVALVNALAALCLWRFGINWQIQVLAFVQGACVAVGAPAGYALLSRVTTESNNIKANAVVRTCRNAASIVAPPLAVLLSQRVGNPGLLLISAILACGSAVALLGVRVNVQVQARPGLRAELRDLGSLFRRNQSLLGFTVLWGIFIAVVDGASSVAQPTAVLHLQPEEMWSVLSSVAATGYVCGSLISTKINTRWLIGGSFFFAAVAVSRLLTVALSDHYWLWLIGAFVGGFAIEVSGVLWGSALQTRTAPEEVGRVSAIDYALSFGLSPLGFAIFGLITTTTNARTVLSASALALIAVAVISAVIGRGADRRAHGEFARSAA